MRSFSTGILLIISLWAYSQNPAEGRLFQKMDLGVDLMNQGKYALAEKEFLYVMNNMTALPSDLAFYFGKNSFYLEKYKQSINWLNKYLQLKGTQGRYYSEASGILQLAEEQYLELSRKNSEAMQSDLSGGDYDCGGLDKMICPVCKGEGVMVKQGRFDRVYQTCPYSGGEPFLTCEEYNLFMRGQLDPKFK